MNVCDFVGLAVEPPLRKATAAYERRVTGSLPWELLAPLDALIADAIDAGVWDGFVWHVWITARQSASLLNVVKDAYNLTATGTPTWLPFFGWQHAPGQEANGKLGYGKTPAQLAAEGVWSLNSHSFLFYALDDSVGATNEGGSAGGGSTLSLRCSNIGQMAAWSASPNIIQARAPQASGLVGVVRTSAAGGFTIKNDAIADFFTPSVSWPGAELTWLKTGGTHTTHIAGVGILGPAITKDQALAINAAIERFRETLGIELIQSPVDVVTGENAFRRSGPYSYAAVAGLGIPVIRIAPRPALATTDYQTFPYFPMSGAATQPQSLAKSSDATIAGIQFVAADRGLGTVAGEVRAPLKPNGIGGTVYRPSDGRQCRLQYRTYAKAMAATETRVAYSIGLEPRADPAYLVEGVPTGWLDIAERAGFDVSGWAPYEAALAEAIAGGNEAAIAAARVPFRTNANIDTGEVLHRANILSRLDTLFDELAVAGTYVVPAIERLFLDEARLCDTANPTEECLDYEVSDRRSPADFLGHMQRLAAMCHAKGYRFGTINHRAGTTSGAASGYDQSINHLVLAAVDYVSIVVAADDPGLTKVAPQIAAFTGLAFDQPVPREKLSMNYVVGQPNKMVTLADTAAARALLLGADRGGTGAGMGQLIISNGGSSPGGPITRAYQQRVAAITGVPGAPA